MSAFLTLSSAYRMIYLGLVVYVLGIVIAIVGAMVGVGALVAGGAGAPGGAAPAPAGGAAALGGMLAVVGVGVAVSLLGAALMLIGKIRCLVVPDDVPGGKTLIGVAVAFQLFEIAVTVFNTVDEYAGLNILPQNAKSAAGGVASLLGFVSILLFLIFTGRLARYIRRSDLARAASTVLKIVIGLMVVMVLMIGSMVAAVGPGVVAGQPPAAGKAPAVGGAAMVGGVAMCGFSVVMIVLGIAGLVLYARLLTNMSKGLARYARDDGDDYDDVGDEEDDYDRPRRRDEEPEDDLDR